MRVEKPYYKNVQFGAYTALPTHTVTLVCLTLTNGVTTFKIRDTPQKCAKVKGFIEELIEFGTLTRFI